IAREYVRTSRSSPYFIGGTGPVFLSRRVSDNECARCLSRRCIILVRRWEATCPNFPRPRVSLLAHSDFHLEPIGRAPRSRCWAATSVLPVVRRTVIPIVVVVLRGVITPLVGVDVGIAE